MKPDHGPPADGSASFHPTRWTIVMRAAQNQTLGAESALAELCRNYWYPLYLFAHQRWNPPEDAQDLTQNLFLYRLEHRAHLSRKRYATLLCEGVGRTFWGPEGVDVEIHALCEALIASEGRVGL